MTLKASDSHNLKERKAMSGRVAARVLRAVDARMASA